MATIYLALGSNLGDRAKNIGMAVEELKNAGVTIKKISSIIETYPVGGPASPAGGPIHGKFLNAVLKAKTRLTPEALLGAIKMIEEKLGRVKTVPNGPRTIDIDILLYDKIKMTTPNLSIPHPRMRERDFVMIPLKEIEPNLNTKFPNENR